jgi:acrylyl-CoA reductase (NADPH)
MFKAIVLARSNDQFTATLREVSDAELLAQTPQADVTVDVAWSTLNYKDGLALTNRSPVVRKWPMIAGIDAAGIVRDSGSPLFKPGDAVVLNGWGCGETQWGGLSQRVRVAGEQLVALPAPFTTRQAMAIGTAGYTAMLCCLALEADGVIAPGNEVLVTGASGGVGSVAVAILAGWGVRVVACTGRLAQAAYLQGLGAAEVIDRQVLGAPGKPLQKERYAGVVDAVGSHTLANACAQVRYGGTVTACGLAQGMDFPATMAPFILRGVRLIGIDSVLCPRPRRITAWQRLARDLDRQRLEAITTEVRLADVIELAPRILAGQVRGRVVVDVNAA